MLKAKKIYIREVIFVFIVTILMFGAFWRAETPTGDKSTDSPFQYQQLADGNYQIIKYTGSEDTLVIPKTYKDAKVTALDNAMFAEKGSIKELELSENITYIGKDLFLANKELHAISVPAGTADDFVALLSFCEMSKEMQTLTLYENKNVSAFVDGKQLEAELQQGTFFYEKKLHESLQVSLSLSQKPMYQLQNGEWIAQESPLGDMTFDNDITWYYQDEDGNQQKLKDGSLSFSDLRKEDEGLYIAMSGEDIVFQMQLDVNDGTYSNDAIDTGEDTSSTMIVITLSLVVILGGVMLYIRRLEGKK